MVACTLFVASRSSFDASVPTGEAGCVVHTASFLVDGVCVCLGLELRASACGCLSLPQSLRLSLRVHVQDDIAVCGYVGVMALACLNTWLLVQPTANWVKNKCRGVLQY